MAAAALDGAGFDVLLTDTTHVVLRYPFGYLRAQRDDVDLWAMRGGCNAKRPEHSEAGLGCGMVWNFLFLRGARDAARGRRVVSFVQDAIDTGMVDFYLRWWAGHHCIFMGYAKNLRGGQARLERGSPRCRTRCAPIRPRSSRCCGAARTLVQGGTVHAHRDAAA